VRTVAARTAAPPTMAALAVYSGPPGQDPTEQFRVCGAPRADHGGFADEVVLLEVPRPLSLLFNCERSSRRTTPADLFGRISRTWFQKAREGDCVRESTVRACCSWRWGLARLLTFPVLAA